MEDVSVVSFPDGIQTLTNAMVKECRERGVTIEMGAKVEAVTVSDDGVEVSLD